MRSPLTKTDITALAVELGFCTARFTPAELPLATSDRLDEFLAEGFEGEMTWLRDTRDRRISPVAMWPEARSAIVLGMNYGPDHDPLDTLEKRSVGNISVYGRNRDYHNVIKGRLKEIAGKIAAYNQCEVKVFVDTAPLMEKPLAHQAGLGWQGKHTNLVSRDKGSWLFLGVILSAFPFEPDTPETDHCGSCRACLDICPTNAFPEPYRLDARRCISYLTIEHASPIPHGFRKAMGNRIYGCDDCLAVCPWNKFASQASEARLIAREDLREPPLTNLLQLDDRKFRALFSGSPVKRIGRDRFIRNCLMAAGNAGDEELLDPVRRLLCDHSPLVRGAAVWAFGELVEPDTFAVEKKRYLMTEKDAEVRREWQLAETGKSENE